MIKGTNFKGTSPNPMFRARKSRKVFPPLPWKIIELKKDDLWIRIETKEGPGFEACRIFNNANRLTKANYIVKACNYFDTYGEK